MHSVTNHHSEMFIHLRVVRLKTAGEIKSQLTLKRNKLGSLRKTKENLYFWRG